MADDHDDLEADEHSTTFGEHAEESAGTTDLDLPTSVDDDGEDRDDGDDSDTFSAETPADPERTIDADRLATDVAMFQMGTLVCSYRHRDVAVTVDGRSAAKVMAVFSGTADRWDVQDTITASCQRMHNLWTVISLDGLLAVSWIPGLPGATPRTMTVDPPPPIAP